MTAKPPKIEQTTPHDSRFDDLRKELSPQINEKLSEKMFCWCFGILIVILAPIFGYFAYQNSHLNDKFDQVNNRLTIIETKLEERKK